MTEKKPHWTISKIPYSIAVPALAGIVVIAFLVLTIAFNGSPTYQNNCHQESYQEQEEYLKTEYYTENVPYTSQECEKKNLIYKKEVISCAQREDNYFANDVPASTSCKISNLDNEPAVFTATIGFDVDGKEITETQQKYIYPQSSAIFTKTLDASIDSCICYETIPTKTVCRDVTKYQEVQKSREVSAYKPVTKYREVCN